MNYPNVINKMDFSVHSRSLSQNASNYVQREVDEALLNAILAGKLVCVFGPHGMGKTSLIAQSSERLAAHGAISASIKLSGVDADLSSEHLYVWLLNRLKSQLAIPIEIEEWWAEREALPPNERLRDFLCQIVLANIDKRVVIFIDDITPVIIKLDFFRVLLDAIQAVYGHGTDNSPCDRLVVALFGEADFTELAKMCNPSTLEAVCRLNLTNFSREEVTRLQKYLETILPLTATTLDRIYSWTSGHPYLTQKLCSAVAETKDPNLDDERVDGLVETLFLSPTQLDSHLQAIKHFLNSHPHRSKLLLLYQQVLANSTIQADDQSPDQNQLRLSGLVRVEDGLLKGSSEIVRQVFNETWIETLVPIKTRRILLPLTGITIILLACIFGIYVYQQTQNAIAAQSFVDQFNQATNSEERLINLAKLFRASSYEDRAKEMFFEEMTPAQQLALFEDLTDPAEVAEPLVTVIRGLYTDSRMSNSEQSNKLFTAMSKRLKPLEDLWELKVIELQLEIDQWQQGRVLYAEKDYFEAVQSFNIAIRMNGNNAGTYFDRGLAYTRLNRPNMALSDFAASLNLDESWQKHIFQAIVDNPEVYQALWREQNNYWNLISLIPTATNTPTSTSTSTSTSTITPIPPSATPTTTSTPVPPPTSTPVPIPTDTATPSPTRIFPTSTPAVPSGRFTLLSPVSLDRPSFGPTTFEWEWSGQLPPDFGFEIKVWREGEPPLGAHNAVLDNKNGNIERIGENRYRLVTNIKHAAGVEDQSGQYLWTVALVRVAPEYGDLGQQAESLPLRYEAGGRSSDGGGDAKGGEGSEGVGID
ncbi:MAG TPA: AAA-like domain-containing protein [Anaerolineae bacterium]|nr:AAA-like domain-containing protein [Anaerolineae bacterium]HMR63660.1 AAA-like domain-containing protein [Anaerolineae bacterium]